MLVLSRKLNERILIGDNIVLTVVEVHGRQVRLGIEAPDSVSIRREELRSRRPAALLGPRLRETGGEKKGWLTREWQTGAALAEVG